MPDDDPRDGDLRYDRMVEEALRSVVGRSLRHAAKHGLPGDHHFYITFRTDHPEARVPARLRERYPNEMTIVLQYQYWDLDVTDEGFSVTLSFGDIPEKLSVPYPAVVAFADPSVQFGLQFDVGNADQSAEPAEEAESGEVGPAPVGAANATAARASEDRASEDGPDEDGPDEDGPDEDGPDEDGPDEDGPGARSENVVPFDTFRKKST